MNLLRHWIVDRPGEAGTFEEITITDERNVQACREAGWRVQGPFVLEAQLAGAVDVLRALARMPLTATGKDFDTLVAAARAMLPEYSDSPVGGQ